MNGQAPLDDRREWIRRVLGIDLTSGDQPRIAPAAAGDSQLADAKIAEALAAIRQIWQDASDKVDAQITALQATLRGTEDDELHEIAEYGLNALTEGKKTRVLVAIHTMGDGANLQQSGTKALSAFTQFREHIETDERVRAFDENPFGVAVALRQTLTPALAQMEARLQGVLHTP
jgi:uncharacterized protein involved in exopolysaccharide biosynthesis